MKFFDVKDVSDFTQVSVSLPVVNFCLDNETNQKIYHTMLWVLINSSSLTALMLDKVSVK